MTLFLKASSLYSIFTQVPKTFNSTVALQVGLLKHLGNIATDLLDSVFLSLFCFFMFFQTDWMTVRSDLCVEHWLLSDSLCKQKSHWIITINGKNNVWKCKLIFPADTLQKKIEITDFKPFFVGENTCGLRLLHSTVHIYIYIQGWTGAKKWPWTFWHRAAHHTINPPAH